MPHRIAAWELMGHLGGLAAAGGWYAAGLSGLFVAWALNAEGWSAAIVIVSGGVAVGLVRMAPSVASFLATVTPPMAGAIRNLGFAWADVRFRNERKVDEAQRAIARLESTLDDVKAMSLEKREILHEIGGRVSSNVVAIEGNSEEIRKVAEENRDRRHEIADQFSGALSRIHAELMEVKQKLGMTDVRDVRAINAVSETVKVVAARVDPDLAARLPLPHVEPVADPEPEPGGRR